jgi:omega-amidase
MRIALFQIDIAWENKDANFKNVESFIEKIKDEKVDLIILPELFSTGYTMNSMALAEDISGETPSFLSIIAKKYNINILGSFIEKTKEKPKNSAILFNKKGELTFHYSKIHLPSFLNENKHYSSGIEISTFELGGHKFGTIICYDLRFPELFRKLVEKEVVGIIVIANWPSERIEHWDVLIKARAVDNQLFVIGVNRVGLSPTSSYPGHSVIVDPFAKVVASYTENEEGIIIGDIDFSLVDIIRKEYPILKDRKL